MLAPLLAQVPQTNGEVVVELTGCEDTEPDAVVVRATLRVRRERLRPIEPELRERVKRVFEAAGIALQLPRQVVVLEGPWSSLPSSAPTTPG